MYNVRVRLRACVFVPACVFLRRLVRKCKLFPELRCSFLLSSKTKCSHALSSFLTKPYPNMCTL